MVTSVNLTSIVFDMQVMRLGAPVTALTLSPDLGMLATAHASSRGIYLWSNQLLFGGAADVLPSQVPHYRLSDSLTHTTDQVNCCCAVISNLAESLQKRRRRARRSSTLAAENGGSN